MTDISQLLSTASAQLYQLVYNGLKIERGVHIETAITAAGYLAGYQLQRASKIDLSKLEPGSSIFNLPGVDDAGPTVINFVAQACARAGITDRPSGDLPIPPRHKPINTYLDLMQRFANPYNKLIETLPPDFSMPWIAPAQTCVKFIVAGKSVLAPATGQALAFVAIVTAAKTVPPR